MNFIDNWLTTNKEELIHIASDIFCHPETAYQETYSSKRLADFLETQGFRVTWKTAGIDTAFTAVWGSGKPMLGFLAEYDALPEIGHACGHNLLGTAVCAAALRSQRRYDCFRRTGNNHCVRLSCRRDHVR